MRPSLALLAVAVAASPAAAQTQLRFRWQPGQAHTFAVRQTTTVTETAPPPGGGKPATAVTTVKLALTRKWAVTAVDAAGTATLDMSILALRQEIVRGGETLVKDSAVPADAAEMGDYLHKPILTAKVDPLGRVTEAKGPAGDGAATRLQTELPFRVVLPEAAVAANGTWERPFAVRLDPPAGTGESHDAKQTFTFRGLADGRAVIGVTTELAKPPSAAADLQPLLPWLWAGEVYLDPQAGAYLGAKLNVKRELPNHAGAGTRFAFESEYTETPAK